MCHESEFSARQWEQVNQFYSALSFGPEDAIGLYVIDDNKDMKRLTEERFIRLERLSGFMGFLRSQNAHGFGIFSTINRLRRNARRRKEQDFESLQTLLHLDLDSKSESASSLLSHAYSLMRMPPTLLVRSSEGNYQGYWVLSSVIESSRIRKFLQAVNKILHIDATQDVTRVMRLPGFRNHKTVQSEGIAKNDMVYIVSQLVLDGREIDMAGRRMPLETFREIERTILPHNAVTPASPVIGNPSSSGPAIVRRLVRADDLERLYAFFHNRHLQRPDRRSPSERDASFVAAALARGTDEALLMDFLCLKRSDKRDPQYYASLTVTKVRNYLLERSG